MHSSAFVLPDAFCGLLAYMVVAGDWVDQGSPLGLKIDVSISGSVPGAFYTHEGALGSV